jgi:hypothetical protein
MLGVRYMSAVFSTAECLEQCTPGRGEVLVAIPDAPEFAGARQAVDGLDPRRAYLTPPSAVQTHHPLMRRVQPCDFYRGPDDWRSFGVAAADIAGHASVTVKGGDLPHMLAVGQAYQNAPLFRVRNRQIPGAALAEHAQHEFDTALRLQQEAYALLGRLTFMALPLRVNTIETIETAAGVHMSLRDYMNGSDYMLPTDQQRSFLGFLPGEGLGDMLLGRYGLRPAQYLYATQGLNVRIHDIVNTRHMRRHDDVGVPRLHPIDDALFEDRLVQREGGLSIAGDYIPPTKGRKQQVFQNTYALLGQTYGFDPSDVLPAGPITDGNYMQELYAIPGRCVQSGVADRVLAGFIGRITEVAALVHAKELIFSSVANVGSSLMPRNVTYAGTVLDLDTVGEPTGEFAAHIAKDYAEMLLSIAALRRLVARERPFGLAGRIYAAYREKLDAFNAPPAVRRRIEEALKASDYVQEMNVSL